jgi:hypothetical protein
MHINDICAHILHSEGFFEGAKPVLSSYSSQLYYVLPLLILLFPRKFQFGKKSAKVYHSLYSSIEQLKVALLTYMFLKFGFNND